MNKRLIIIIVAAIFVLLGIATLLFLAVKKQNQAQQPVVTTPQIKKILDETVISPIASFDNSAIWYFNSDSRLFRVNTDGSGLSEFPLPALTDAKLKQVLWPKTGSDFIAITGLGASEVKNYYNSTQKIYIKLPIQIKNIDWLPDATRVVYIWQSSDNTSQSLAMADADGTGFLTISPVFWPDLVPKASPDGKTVLLYRSKIEGDVNKIYSVNIETKAFSTIIDLGKNLGAVWLPNENKFIYAQGQASAAYPELFLYDSANQKSVDLNLNTTLDKIVFDKDGKFLYAAVPKKDNTTDTFVKLDLNNLKQETYFEPTENLHAKGLIMIGDTLYFTNTQDQKFYTIVK